MEQFSGRNTVGFIIQDVVREFQEKSVSIWPGYM